MATTTKQTDSRRSALKAARQPAASVPEVAPAPDVDGPVAPVVEMARTPDIDGAAAPAPGVKPAYLTYLHARKGLATAFRGRQLRDREALEDAQKCYQAYQQAMDNAVKAKEKAEREALGLYRTAVDSAVDKASQEYRERMRQASAQCKKVIDDAWKASMETSTTMAGIFENDEVLPPRGEPEQSARGRTSFTARAADLLETSKKGWASVARQSTAAVKRLVTRNGKRTKESAVDAHS